MRGDMKMAKEIELGLSLKGNDARKFHEYMKNPDDTEEGRKLLKEALRLSKSSQGSSKPFME